MRRLECSIEKVYLDEAFSLIEGQPKNHSVLKAARKRPRQTNRTNHQNSALINWVLHGGQIRNVQQDKRTMRKPEIQIGNSGLLYQPSWPISRLWR